MPLWKQADGPSGWTTGRYSADTELHEGATYAHYRAQRDYDALLAWFRGKGLTAIKPLHELRSATSCLPRARSAIQAALGILP